jgi:hypothetical protein
MTTHQASATRARVAGRLVVLVRGRKSQTINVCTEQNERGRYEARYRLPANADVSVAGLEELADLEALRAWAEAHHGDAEAVGSSPGCRLPPRIAAPAVNDKWLKGARAAAERSLKIVVDEFLDRPYLHRVEHSLHAWLFSILVQQPELQGVAVLATGEHTQLVHKEWPETIAGKEGADEGPRGLFDLAIVSPAQLSSATLDQFRAGRIDAPIVIEVGLDYGLAHLEQDADKLTHSEVLMPYLLHLSRIAMRDQDKTEQLLCSPSTPIRTAYVHHDQVTGTSSYKHVSDMQVSVRSP